MSTSTIIFFALLIFFTWRSYQKGFFKSITRILSWIVAYPAAIFFTKPFAQWLMANTALDGVLVYFVAGTILFLAVSFIVSALLNLFAKLIPDNSVTNLGSKVGGAGLGAVIGALVGLVVVYAFNLFMDFKTASREPEVASTDSILEQPSQQGIDEPATGVPALSELEKSRDSFIEASARKLVGNAAATAVDLVADDAPTTQITRAFAQDPQTTLMHVEKASQDGQLQTLMADEGIQSIMTTGDVNALMRDPAFNQLMANPNVRALMTQSNVTNDQGSKVAAETMIKAWNRVQLVKHDPRIVAILRDQEFQQQLNSPNKLPLMMNPKLNQLAEIIFSTKPVAANGLGDYTIQQDGGGLRNATNELNNSQDQFTQQNNDDGGANKTIYQWKDESGQLHYSDKPQKPHQ